MAEEVKPSAEAIRKTVSLTHRQLGVTGLIGLAVAITPYLKEAFVTKQEGAVMAVQVEYIRKDVTEIKTMLDANTQRILEEVKESDKRTVKNEDRLEHRIDILESLSRIKSN